MARPKRNQVPQITSLTGRFCVGGHCASRPTSKGLGKAENWGMPMSARIFTDVGKGTELLRNRQGHCKTVPARNKREDYDEVFERVRGRQVKQKDVGATRYNAAGWYQGREVVDAMVYEVFFDPDAGETKQKFRSNMRDIAEAMGKAFCQDAVIVEFSESTKTGTKRQSCGYIWDHVLGHKKKRTKVCG